MNRVVLIGNLTRDAELKKFDGGQLVRMGLAISERYYDKKEDAWKSRPNFVDCVLFGKRAEAIAKYLTKGTHVAVDGKLSYSSWKDDDNKTRSKLEVIVSEIEFQQKDTKED